MSTLGGIVRRDLGSRGGRRRELAPEGARRNLLDGGRKVRADDPLEVVRVELRHGAERPSTVLAEADLTFTAIAESGA